jgi:protein-tyrosine phosphatase
VFAHKIAARQLQRVLQVDSAGTGDWHVGEPPDARSCRAAEGRGYDLSALRARQVCAEDFQRFDYILAMDRANLAELQRIKPADYRGELDLFLRYADAGGALEVPDPYHGGERGFEQVLDLLEDAAEGLLRHLQQERP